MSDRFELSGDAFGFNFRFLLPLVPSEQNAEDLLKAEEGEPKFFKGNSINLDIATPRRLSTVQLLWFLS